MYRFATTFRREQADHNSIQAGQHDCGEHKDEPDADLNFG
jgi:hypothetical protein